MQGVDRWDPLQVLSTRDDGGRDYRGPSFSRIECMKKRIHGTVADVVRVLSNRQSSLALDEEYLYDGRVLLPSPTRCL